MREKLEMAEQFAKEKQELEEFFSNEKTDLRFVGSRLQFGKRGRV